jgi:Kef-type K+ transport system membrane component KefB
MLDTFLPAIELSHLGHFLMTLLLMLLAAKLGGEGASRLGQSSVLGELLAGTLIGPFALGWIHIDHTVQLLAELGVILLLFETGMETNLRQLLKVGWQSAAVATTGIVLPFASGFMLGQLLGLEVLVSLLVGATLTATSIGITARTLSDLDELDSAEGRIIIGTAVIDDVVGLMILAVMQVLLQSGAFSVGILGQTLLQTLFFSAMAFIVGRFAAQPFMRWVDHFQASGALTALSLVFVLAVCLGARSSRPECCDWRFCGRSDSEPYATGAYGAPSAAAYCPFCFAAVFCVDWRTAGPGFD